MQAYYISSEGGKSLEMGQSVLGYLSRALSYYDPQRTGGYDPQRG